MGDDAHMCQYIIVIISRLFSTFPKRAYLETLETVP